MLKFITSPTYLWIGLFLLFGLFQAEKVPNESKSLQHLLEAQIPGWMESYEVPGVSIALIKDGTLQWVDAYGLANLSKKIPMTPQTICRVESISKSVTARAILKLAENGKIKLDDPVTKYLKSWEFPESEFDPRKVTIRRILSNSAGLPLGTLGLEYAPSEKKPSLRESLAREADIIFEPGSRFSYSNVGFNLLEILIEDVTDQKFAEYMRTEVLTAIGMENSDFEWSEDFITPVPDGHNLNGEPVPVYVYSEKAAGGLFSNVEDLGRFVASGMVGEFFKEDNTLSEQGLRGLYSPAVETAGVYSLVSDYYGMGHFTEVLPNGQTAVFSGGQGNGWMTHFHLFPETGDGIVILTNSSRSWPLISQILSLWTDESNIETVGMELIAKARTGLWIIVALMFLLCFGKAFQIVKEAQKGLREFNLALSSFKLPQVISAFSFVILTALLLWIQTLEYLFLTSVFPVAATWFLNTLWIASVVLLMAVLLPKKAFHPNLDLNA